ncbi:MAG: hypothetical protein CL908_01215 [Deltaproteobacteria bacterium]|nr:hypothetical protein [Deltaproteobacteria bacterium]
MSPDPPHRRPGEQRRHELINAAIDVFGEAGFAGARIDEVARRVGIRRPSVLYHFPDKQALYSASIEDVVVDIWQRIRSTEQVPGDRLEAIADGWVDFVIERPNAARLLLRQLIDADPLQIPAIDAPIRGLFEVIQRAIEDRTGSATAKRLDATEFSLILSSTSLVWVASRSAVEGALGLDTLSPQAVQRHRRTLHVLIRQLLDAADGADEPAARTLARSPSRPDPESAPGLAGSRVGRQTP